MQASIVEIDSEVKAKELLSILSSMKFVTKVSPVRKPKALMLALEEHENMKMSILKKRTRRSLNIFNESTSKRYSGVEL